MADTRPSSPGLPGPHAGRIAALACRGGLRGRGFRRPVRGRHPGRGAELHGGAARGSPLYPDLVGVVGRGRLPARLRLLSGRLVADDDFRGDVRGFPDPPLLRRVHDGGGRRLQPLLRIHEPVRVRHAHAAAGGQPDAAPARLGGRRALQLPADRLLLQGRGQRPGREQGVHRHPGGRHRHAHGALPALRRTGHPGHPGAAPTRRPAVPAGLGPGGGGGAAAAGRSRGQVRPAPAPDLVAGRHGRPDSGERPHPRGDHGDRRCLSHRPHSRAVHPGAGGVDAGGGRRHPDPADGGVRRAGADRHQARAGLLHHQPDRLHVPGPGGGGVVRRTVPLHDPRLLQGAAVPGRGRGDHGPAPRAGQCTAWAGCAG